MSERPPPGNYSVLVKCQDFGNYRIEFGPPGSPGDDCRGRKSPRIFCSYLTHFGWIFLVLEALGSFTTRPEICFDSGSSYISVTLCFNTHMTSQARQKSHDQGSSKTRSDLCLSLSVLWCGFNSCFHRLGPKREGFSVGRVDTLRASCTSCLV